MPKEIFDFYDRTNLKSYNLDKTMQYQLNILGSLDMFTRKHSENVAAITCRICEFLHCNKNFTEYCTICAYLHDVGKQFIPPSVLQKSSALTDEEYEIMKTHTTIGNKICMDDLKLRPYAAGTIYHHEALNGTGYPRGLVKKDIPYEGQIIRVADEYDAMVSKRQYKSHMNISEVLNILITEAQPTKDNKVSVKDAKYGKINPVILKALMSVVICDTEYEISCIMDYLKDIKSEIKRLKEIEKYDIKRKASKTEKKQNYYLEGMKIFLATNETPDNYSEILSSYENILNTKNKHVDDLFNEIKIIKKLKSKI